jgi:hypothetical protein
MGLLRCFAPRNDRRGRVHLWPNLVLKIRVDLWPKVLSMAQPSLRAQS